MELLHVVAFILGVAFVAGTLLSAVRTFVLPRAARPAITRVVFISVRSLFRLRTRRARSYEAVDHMMAMYAPIALLILPVVWMIFVGLGYMLIYWGVGIESWEYAFRLSGSSLLTLGFTQTIDMPTTLLAFSEAAIGLILIALLIAYLPVMYGAFSRREAAVSELEVRAGTPPSAVYLFELFNRLERFDTLGDFWSQWEDWFAELDETHTSLAPLVFFRSPHADRSWITAAGAVLDAAALAASTIDIPYEPRANLCIRAGYLALRHIADFFRISYDPQPKMDDPISISREEFDEAYDRLQSNGVPLKPDREQAWRDFAGWRVNYDTVLIGLAHLTLAPYAPWSSDRSILPQRTRK